MTTVLTLRRIARLAIPLAALALVALVTGCTGHGDLRFAPFPAEEHYSVAGRINLTAVTESDLMWSLRGPAADIAVVTDFSKFVMSAGSASPKNAEKSGDFELESVKPADDLMLQAKADKVVLLRHIYLRDLRETDSRKLDISLLTTAKALVWKKARERNIELTDADISAREYEPWLASITTALKFALQMPDKDVPKTILDLSMVTTPVTAAANVIIPREKLVREAYSVFENALLNESERMLEYLISPDFSNDWDTESSYTDFQKTLADYFTTYDITVASYTIQELEFLPGEIVRARVFAQITAMHRVTGLSHQTALYHTDTFWQREGTYWKIRRNLPYKLTHPTQVAADARWGEIARAHVLLRDATYREDMEVFKTLFSTGFGNDWDIESTYTDFLLQTKKQFDENDTQLASYTIRSIEFVTSELAKARISFHLKFISHATGYIEDWGLTNAVVDWKWEDGAWKVFRNFPYKATHPKDLK
ncbi:MAG TPA: hypothetical protein PKO06_12485 [Candidatus Ozemobacteraceae bacterium]|nr:hypothetical protein [Candidatus Ozemobacteraceae bacterium]